jgi:hypothetical protein
MTHTHYALINEDNDVVAVIKRANINDKLQAAKINDKVQEAIEDETGDRVLKYELIETDYCNYQARFILEGDVNVKHTYTLRPTWEY